MCTVIHEISLLFFKIFSGFNATNSIVKKTDEKRKQMIHRHCSFQATLKCIAVVVFHMRCNLFVLFPHSRYILFFFFTYRKERECDASKLQQEMQSRAFVELKPCNVLFSHPNFHRVR